MNQLTNGIDGHLHVSIDICDFRDDLPDTELCALVVGDEVGSDSEPTLTLFTRSPGDQNGCDQLWTVSIERMRAILDMAEQIHAVGRAQFKAAERKGR